jgi:glycosyltransferase involved in cell wall biosynthesis
MQQLNPSITIIVACLNNAKTILQTIDSVANQTYPNAELIVIDGGSSDGSVDLLKENSEKITYWISEPDKGIYNAWNKGLDRATGDWICFLGADDFLWDDQSLEDMSRTLSSISCDRYVAYGQVMLLTKESQPLYSIGKPWPKVKKQFAKFMSIPHPGLMHRHELFKKNGNFDESFRIAGDYELLLRELKISDATYIPKLMVGVRQGGVSCNLSHSFALLYEVRRAQIKNGFYLPSASWILSFVRLVFRKAVWHWFGENSARKILDFGRSLIGLPKYWTRT